jgi:nicotinamide mononucleotide transporter
MQQFWEELSIYAVQIDFLELSGLVFGLLAVFFLIKENILTWPSGIIYVLISFVIFWQQRLYGDFILHVFFLVLNIYGWYYWIAGRKKDEEELPITTTSSSLMIKVLAVSGLGILLFGYFLDSIHLIWPELGKAAVPYWDSTTSILSVMGMWLTARKKIENWYFWVVVDVLATGIYIYKGIYFYATLYGIYIFLAVVGYLAWKKSMETTKMQSVVST